MPDFLRKTIFFLILFSAAVSAFSVILYMPDDPEVHDLVVLYTKAGFVFPDESFPVSRADLNEYASRLLYRVHRKKIRSLIRKYRSELDFVPKRVYRGHNTRFDLSGFLNGDVYHTEGQNRYPDDFYNRFVKFPDLGYFSLFTGKEGKSGLDISVGLKREYLQDDVPDTNLFMSKSSDPMEFENYFIRKGYLFWRTGSFEFRFGRTPVHYGDAHFSTFLPSDRLPWLDTFTYRYEVGPLTMTSYFGTIDSRITDDEENIFIKDRTTLYADDGTPVTFSDTDPVSMDVDGTPSGYNFRDTIILNSMHRFVLTWEKLRIGMTSSIIVARRNNAIQIGDLFPVFSWHNAVLGSNNMNLVFDAGYSLVPGVFLYGQAAWDDINATDLVGIPDSSVPTIGAYLFGASYAPEAKNNRNVVLKMEIGKTHYLWGNYYVYDRWKGSYLSRAIYRYHAQKGTYWMPLTSPYGPGTWWVEGDSSCSVSKNLDVSTGILYLRFNSRVNLFTTPYASDASLDGYDSTSFSLHLKATYRYPLKKNNVLYFSVTPYWYSLKGHQWPEIEISAAIKGQKLVFY